MDIPISPSTLITVPFATTTSWTFSIALITFVSLMKQYRSKTDKQNLTLDFNARQLPHACVTLRRFKTTSSSILCIWILPSLSIALEPSGYVDKSQESFLCRLIRLIRPMRSAEGVRHFSILSKCWSSSPRLSLVVVGSEWCGMVVIHQRNFRRQSEFGLPSDCQSNAGQLI